MNEKLIERFKTTFEKLKPIAGQMLVELGDESRVLERARHKPRVLVVGEFNTGKSSLVNSAIGETLLPVGVTPTTSLTTVLQHGPFRLEIKPIGQKDPIKVEPGKDQSFGYGIKEGGFDWAGLKQLLTDQKNIDQIEQVLITHPAAPESIVIIDTPGINDLSKSRAEVVYGFIPQADIVVFLINATKPFSESERVFLEERILAGDLKKVLFVVNHLDEIEEHERAELIQDIHDQVRDAVNKGLDNLNQILGSTLHPKIEKVTLLPACAKLMAPLDGKSTRGSIGFATGGNRSENELADMNRAVWQQILKAATADREKEVEATLHHHLRRSAMKITRAIDATLQARQSGNDAMLQRLRDNSDRLKKLRDTFRSSEVKIKKAEAELKERIHAQIEKTVAEMANTGIWNRDPNMINQRLKDLYEYITNSMKSRLDELYAELGQDFDAILEDKRFMEEHHLQIQYDLSDLPNKIVSSLSFAYLAAIFFGISVGMFAGAAYFASQVIANKRSIKQYLLSMRVKEDKLLEVKKELLYAVDQEIEYAIDFVRQSLSQRADIIQGDVRNLVFALTRDTKLDVAAIQKSLESVQPEINAFLLPEKPVT
ncbi:MAG TPA: dynamin family protein [Candidatus Ozemobacteraceae bacterium]|nr:dynamin family protein [Candidatus Ozemobacteraceae bacterium]